MKKVEGQVGLNFNFEEEEVINKDDREQASVLPPAEFKQVDSCKKVHQKVVERLSVAETPSVTLHKGGGKIVITPNDIMASISLLEIRERIAALSNPVLTADRTKLTIQLLPDVTPEDFTRATRAWSLVGVKLEQ